MQLHQLLWLSLVLLVVKNPPPSAGDVRDTGSIPGLGRAPGEGNGYPLQYSCLENPMDRGSWWVPGHGVAKSRTWLKQLSIHSIQLLYLSGPLLRLKPLPQILLSPFLLSSLFALRGAWEPSILPSLHWVLEFSQGCKNCAPSHTSSFVSFSIGEAMQFCSLAGGLISDCLASPSSSPLSRGMM